MPGLSVVIPVYNEAKTLEQLVDRVLAVDVPDLEVHLHERPAGRHRERQLFRTNDLRQRPVPAAHLSFMIKLVTFPFSSHRMALHSCPPISRIVRTEGRK